MQCILRIKHWYWAPCQVNHSSASSWISSFQTLLTQVHLLSIIKHGEPNLFQCFRRKLMTSMTHKWLVVTAEGEIPFVSLSPCCPVVPVWLFQLFWLPLSAVLNTALGSGRYLEPAKMGSEMWPNSQNSWAPLGPDRDMRWKQTYKLVQSCLLRFFPKSFQCIPI